MYRFYLINCRLKKKNSRLSFVTHTPKNCAYGLQKKKKVGVATVVEVLTPFAGVACTIRPCPSSMTILKYDKRQHDNFHKPKSNDEYIGPSYHWTMHLRTCFLSQHRKHRAHGDASFERTQNTLKFFEVLLDDIWVLLHTIILLVTITPFPPPISVFTISLDAIRFASHVYCREQ